MLPINFYNIRYSILLIILLITSCDSANEPLFSCDEHINHWVETNLKTVHQLNRQQWLTIKTIGQKIATYRGFTSEQKHKFWHDKLKEVKMLDWNSEELKHIDTLINFIDEYDKIFTDNFKNKTIDEELEDTFDVFMYTWTQDAKDNLNWSDRTIFAIIGAGEKMLSKDGDIELPEKTYAIEKLSVPDEQSGDCFCNDPDDYCNFILEIVNPNTIKFDCVKNGCQVKSGCGWMFNYDCNRQCIARKN